MYTNSTNASSGSDPIAQLISKVIGKYDSDKDGKLSSTEFGKFLGGLLGGGGTALDVARPTNSPSPQPVSTGVYRSRLSGFDFTKMDDPSLPGAGTSKYIAARIFQDYPPQPESLPAVVDRLRAQGINATQTSFDKIDFGDGYGPIDVIQGAYPGGGVAWQWMA